MTRRPGLTMTEVLVAIFVVAIGLAGVMSMVPFGAKQMSDALVIDRATSHATTIDGMVRSYWKEKIVENPGNTEPFWVALDNPGNGLPAPGATEASYPVFLDPIGTGRGAPSRDWVGDGGNTSVPRRTMNAFPLGSSNLAIRSWSQPDGFEWDEESQPAQISKGLHKREYRYNGLAVIQRPNNGSPTTASFKVVVFSNRRPGFFPTGSEVVFNNITMTPSSTEVKLPKTADVQKGSWIMDGTVMSAAPFIRHANFYRIISAVDNGSVVSGVPMLDLELHTPITRVDGKNTVGDTYTNGTIVVMPGIASVFERPQLTGGQ